MSTEIAFFHIICIIFAFLSLSLGAFLLILKSGQNRANVFLGLLVLAYSLFFLPSFFEALGILEKTTFIIRLNFFSGVLTGPFTYLYCKAAIEKEPIKLKNIYVHFLTFIAALAYFYPFFFKSAEEKITVYHHVIATGQVPQHKLVIILLLLHTMIYTLLSIRIVIKYLRHLENTSSSIDASFHRWLLFLSSSLLFPIFMVILIIITSTAIVPTIVGLLSIASIILIVYLALTLKPKFFHYFPHQMEPEDEPEDENQKYQNSNLRGHQKTDYQNRLIQSMEKEKYFLNPELTISEFSEQLNIPAYHISQIINQELGCNFLDFVNRYRIEEAKTKLRDTSLSHYTILSLAFDSGFNSKTAFYSAFKKNVATTPSRFRKEALLTTNYN